MCVITILSFFDLDHVCSESGSQIIVIYIICPRPMSSIVAVGPARMCVKSTMYTPFRGGGMGQAQLSQEEVYLVNIQRTWAAKTLHESHRGTRILVLQKKKDG